METEAPAKPASASASASESTGMPISTKLKILVAVLVLGTLATISVLIYVYFPSIQAAVDKIRSTSSSTADSGNRNEVNSFFTPSAPELNNLTTNLSSAGGFSLQAVNVRDYTQIEKYMYFGRVSTVGPSSIPSAARRLFKDGFCNDSPQFTKRWTITNPTAVGINPYDTEVYYGYEKLGPFVDSKGKAQYVVKITKAVTQETQVIVLAITTTDNVLVWSLSKGYTIWSGNSYDTQSTLVIPFVNDLNFFSFNPNVQITFTTVCWREFL